MLVSYIVPACDAHDSIGATVHSLLAQHFADWEAIVVSDDGFDYLAHLAAMGLGDVRLRMLSTGGHRTGAHRARNVGLAAARGDYVTQLDADDEIAPSRIVDLLPLASRHGAAADNLILRDAGTGATLYRALGDGAVPADLGVNAIVALSAPLVPLIRRDHLLPRDEGVELAEDVIANIRLGARIGRLPVVASSSYIYNVNGTSMCHRPGAAAAFDAAYATYIERLAFGDGFGLPAAVRNMAKAALIDKRAMNGAYAAATTAGYAGTFQHFALRFRVARDCEDRESGGFNRPPSRVFPPSRPLRRANSKNNSTCDRFQPAPSRLDDP